MRAHLRIPPSNPGDHCVCVHSRFAYPQMQDLRPGSSVNRTCLRAMSHPRILRRTDHSLRTRQSFEEQGDFAPALEEWRKSLEMLPAQSTQAEWVRDHELSCRFLPLSQKIIGPRNLARSPRLQFSSPKRRGSLRFSSLNFYAACSPSSRCIGLCGDGELALALAL